MKEQQPPLSLLLCESPYTDIDCRIEKGNSGSAYRQTVRLLCRRETNNDEAFCIHTPPSGYLLPLLFWCTWKKEKRVRVVVVVDDVCDAVFVCYVVCAFLFIHLLYHRHRRWWHEEPHGRRKRSEEEEELLLREITFDGREYQKSQSRNYTPLTHASLASQPFKTTFPAYSLDPSSRAFEFRKELSVSHSFESWLNMHHTHSQLVWAKSKWMEFACRCILSACFRLKLVRHFMSSLWLSPHLITAPHLCSSKRS